MDFNQIHYSSEYRPEILISVLFIFGFVHFGDNLTNQEGIEVVSDCLQLLRYCH